MNNYLQIDYERKIKKQKAGKNLLTDNFLYFNPLSNNKKIKEVSQNIFNHDYKNISIMLYDKIGCCSNLIMKNLKHLYKENSDIFCFYDDEFNIKKISGILVQNRNLFIFDFRNNKLNADVKIDANNYYFCNIDERRKNSCEKYIELSEYFFGRM